MSIRSFVAWMPLCVACGSPSLAPSPLSVCRFPAEGGVPAVQDRRADIRIVYDANDAVGMRLARDVGDALREMTGVPFPYAATGSVAGAAGLLCPEPNCPRHAIAVGLLAAAVDAHAPRGQSVRTRRLVFAGRSVWLVEGASERESAYAAYRFLEALGVRFLHPRRSYVPWRPALGLDWLVERAEAPGFSERVWRFETRKATPASWAFLQPGREARDEAVRMVDWLVANGQTGLEWRLLDAPPAAHTREIIAYAHARRMQTGAVTALYRGADHQLSLIDPGETDAAIAARVAAIAELGFDELVVTLDEREAWLPGAQVVAGWLMSVAAAVAQHAPLRWRLSVRPNSRAAEFASLAPAVDVEGIAYSPLFAERRLDAQLGLLERLAPKGGVGFGAATAAGGGLDIDAPTFLPFYWYVRWVDANRLLTFPEVTRHVTSDLGWEWGYWTNAAVAFAVAWDRERGFRDTLAQLFAPLGRNTCDRLIDVLGSAAALQYETAVGAELGGELAGRPSQASPAWDGSAALVMPRAAFALPLTDPASFSEHVLAPLASYIEQWTVLERALVPTLPRVDAPARPFVQEIIDAFTSSRLKASHRHALLGAMLDLQHGDAAAAEAALRTAREMRNLASLIVSARESQYPYSADFLAGVASNQTAYPYGYLRATRTLEGWLADEHDLERLLYAAEVTR